MTKAKDLFERAYNDLVKKQEVPAIIVAKPNDR